MKCHSLLVVLLFVTSFVSIWANERERFTIFTISTIKSKCLFIESIQWIIGGLSFFWKIKKKEIFLFTWINNNLTYQMPLSSFQSMSHRRWNMQKLKQIEIQLFHFRCKIEFTLFKLKVWEIFIFLFMISTKFHLILKKNDELISSTISSHRYMYVSFSSINVVLSVNVFRTSQFRINLLMFETITFEKKHSFWALISEQHREILINSFLTLGCKGENGFCYPADICRWSRESMWAYVLSILNNWLLARISSIAICPR